MFTCKCTTKLNDLIGNLNNEHLKKICRNIRGQVNNIANSRIDNFYRLHADKHIRDNTNEHIFKRQFFLEVVEDFNDTSIKNNAGFVFDFSYEDYDYFEENIVDPVDPTKKMHKEMIQQISKHRQHMHNNRLIVKLTEPKKYIHVFHLKMFT